MNAVAPEKWCNGFFKITAGNSFRAALFVVNITAKLRPADIDPFHDAIVSLVGSAERMRSMSSEIVSATQTVVAVDSGDLLRRLGPEFLRSGFQLEVLESFSTLGLKAPVRPVAALVRCPHSLSLFARTCQQIREEAPDMPLVVLSPRTDIETKILLFEMGADDYVEEPFAVDELIARLRSIIRSRKHMGAKA